MTKRILSLVLAALTLVFCLAGCNSKENKTDWARIEEKGELVIGMTYYQPMNYKNENGELVGFETEFAKEVCKKLGVKAKFQEIIWDSKIQELDSKNVDVLWNGMTVLPNIKEQVLFSNPYMKNSQVAVIRKADAKKYIDLKSMAGARVVAEAGSSGEAALKNVPELAKNYTPVQSQSATFTEVKSKTADISIVDAVTAAGTIGDNTSYKDLMIVKNVNFGEPEQYAVAMRKDDKVTAEKINGAIKELYDEGTIQNLAEKYGLDGRVIAQ